MRKKQPLLSALVVFFIFLTLGIVFINNMTGREISEHKAHIQNTVTVKAQAINSLLDHALLPVYVLASVLRQEDDREIDDFDALAADMIEDYGGINSLQLAPNGVIRQIYPLEADLHSLGHDIFKAHEGSIETKMSVESRQATLVGPIEFTQGGGRGLIGRMPVYLPNEKTGEEEFWGFTLVIIRLDDFLSTLELETLTEDGHDYELYRINPDTGEKQVFARSSNIELEDPVSFDFEVPNGKWTLAVKHRKGWFSMPHLFINLSIAALLSFLAAALTFTVLNHTQNLREYSKKLEHSNQLKDLFTDIMTHDLLNPTTVVKGMTQMALMDEEDQDKKEALQNILESTERIIGMIENASILAKLESGEEMVLEEQDLGDILRNAAAQMKGLVDEKKMEIKINAEGEFKAPVNPLIYDLFSNLIGNAIKYGPENSGVVVGIKEDGPNWRISVADSGPGIPDEYKEGIFDRFTRIQKHGVKGTGLGLAIVKRVVESHRGKIWMKDNPGGGSIFYVSLPKKV